MLALLAEVSAGVPDAPSTRIARWFDASSTRLAGWCGTATVERASLAAEKSAEAVLPAGIVAGGWEGPNAKPSVRTFVLVIVALTAANPFGGLVGRGRG